MFLIGGCATTDEKVMLNYTPQVAKRSLAHQTKPIYVKEVTDARQENPKLIMHKINANYEDASGRYLSERPLADIFKHAIEVSLQQAGYHLAGDANYQLSASILNVHSSIEEELFSSIQHMSIQVEFTLVDKRSKEEVWDQIFTGRGQYSSKENLSEPLRTLFIRTADNLFNQLLSNNSFKTVMRK